jgi:ADP-ribosylglycohydrolase
MIPSCVHTPPYFARLLSADFDNLASPEIKSTGFVIDTIEASKWCFLNTSNISDAVLKAVNLAEYIELRV